MHFGRWAAAGFLCGLGLAACKFSEVNEEHCANNEGDATCLSRYPDGSRPYCGRGSCYSEVEDGCLGESERPTEDACASPCGGQTYADEPGGRDCLDGGTDAADDDGGMTTGPTGDGPGTVGPDTDTDPGMTMGMTDDGSGSSSDDGPMGCAGDDDCTEANAPFCVEMLCSACSATGDPDAACAEKFPETPVCSASECVQCTAAVTTACTGTTPLCDPATNTCVGCTAHEDCPDSACHIPYPDAAHATDDDGACFDPATVVHVDGDGGQDFTTIGAAAGSFGVGAEGVIIVHAMASQYNEAVSVTGNRVLAILAAPGEEPEWIQGSGSGGSHLSLTNASTTVFLDRMRLALNGDSSDAAVNLNDGRVHIQRSAIVQNAGGGIAAENNALVYVENSFLGDGTNNRTPVQIDTSTAEFVYSTIMVGFHPSQDAYAIACTAPSNVSVRNSLLMSFDIVPADLACADATVTHTGSFQLIAGEGNVALGTFNDAWFDDYGVGDFHLNAPPAAVATTAQWQMGDPLTDIDGQARPNTNGAMDYAGADIP